MPLITEIRGEFDRRLAVFVPSLAVVTAALCAMLLAEGWTIEAQWSVVALAVVAAIAERGDVKLTATTEESISLIPTLFAAVLFGPLAAMIVGAASMLGDLERPYLKWATYTCSRAINGAITGLVAVAATKIPASDVGSLVIATACSALVAEVLDVAFASLAARVRATRSVREVVRTLAPLVASSAPMYAPVVALLALAYRELSPWTMPLFFAPALAAQRLFALYQEQRELARGLADANDRLERANLSFATALVATLDARDRYTAGHSAAVAIYARDIATRLGLSEAEQQLVHLCGLVHDIGKVGLPAGLLEKPGALTLDERRVMETHAEIGERILANVDDYEEIARVVRHHHERVDGLGYPDGLAGSEIPLLSRIIAVADAYDAMTSDRPYRDAMPSRVARLRLAQAVESQFDTTVVAAFEAILAGSDEAYRSGTAVAFAFEEAEIQASSSVAFGAA